MTRMGANEQNFQQGSSWVAKVLKVESIFPVDGILLNLILDA